MEYRHRSVASRADMPDASATPRDMPLFLYGDFLVLLLVSIGFAAGLIFILVAHPEAPHVPHRDVVGAITLLCLITAWSSVAAIYVGLDTWRTIKYQRKRLARLRARSLPERAKRAAAVLQEATNLVEELRSELDARSALLADVKRQAAETNRRAEDMEKLARVDDETTRILNKYFDEALAVRLETLEHGARRREWLLGTVGALLFGIIAILLSHYLLGF